MLPDFIISFSLHGFSCCNRDAKGNAGKQAEKKKGSDNNWLTSCVSEDTGRAAAISPAVPAQQSLIPFDSEVTSHLGAILGRSRARRIINSGRRMARWGKVYVYNNCPRQAFSGVQFCDAFPRRNRRHSERQCPIIAWQAPRRLTPALIPPTPLRATWSAS